ncbi:carboxymuconolactone decarboxylase family protein [Brevibacterium sp.]|uniref:carboxymuconolactone decarboxylase family protein n=1 Tax=Brevibacterium sp. TaxID=1701 RepID=UPI00281263C7|nr:carboxymuconolactone decarboxylase family protein [Brevibacterium sp.]
MARLNLEKASPKGFAAVRRMEAHIRSTVDPELLEFVKIRASILNGCGFCIDMHTTEARSKGMAARRLHAVAGWQHAGELFEERERAVLALTDAVTQISADSVSDEVWGRVKQHFSDEEIGDLLVAIGTINVWNRISIAAEVTPPVDAQHPVE